MKAKPMLVDTDVLIDFLRGEGKACALLEKQKSRTVLKDLAVSAISVAELYAGVRDEAELAILDDFVGLFRVIPVTKEVARIGGLHRRDFKGSHGVGVADAIIAAAAESEGAELLTLNVRHFPMLKGLVPAYRKT